MQRYVCRICLLFILFFSFLQASCSNKSDITSHEDKTEYQNPVFIYLLSDTPDQGKDAQEEWFYNVKDFSQITAQTRPLIPWPKAVRISDIAETENGTIVVFINKKGVVTLADYLAGSTSGNGTTGNATSIKLNKETTGIIQKPSLQEIDFFSSKITHESFANYTSGKIIINKNFALCHVYIDTFFDNNFSAPLSPFTEIDIDNKKSIYSQHNYPAITKSFSLVNLKKADDKWFSAWKKSDANGTMFKYLMHNSPLGENASEITESRFMHANQVLNKSNLPNILKDFISDITKVEINNNSIIEVELRSKDDPVVITYLLGIAGSDSSHYEKMCVSSEQGKYFISYKGEIYLIENDKLYCFSGVEKLPTDYNYTVLYSSGDTLYAAWEQQRFFLTGACGLTLIDKKRVDKIPQ